jgi:hypothetical protein
MKSSNFMFTVSVGVSNSILVPKLAVLDTGVGLNLIREDVLPQTGNLYASGEFRPQKS